MPFRLNRSAHQEPIVDFARRSFLRGGAAMGIASALPVLLSACGGSGDGDATPADGRETRHLHFDLSGGGIAEPRLQAYRSAHHRRRLKVHDAASRARHRALNPVLAEVPDAQLTHYLEDVDLPADALQLLGVWGRHPESGAPVLGGHFLHVPSASLRKLQTQRAARGERARAMSMKLGAYAVSAQALDAAPVEAQIAFNAAAWDVATWLVFQHPAVTNLQPDLAADILDRIQALPCNDSSGANGCIPFLGELAQAIGALIGANRNYPTTTDTGSWAMLVPLVDADTGETQLDDEGNVVYTYRMNEALSGHVASVVKSVLASITNDPAFAGTNWQSTAGAPATVPVQTAVAAAVAQAWGGAGASTRATAQADDVLSPVLSHPVGKRIGGIRLAGVSATTGRAVRLTVRNEFLRAAGIYIEYQDANGTTLAVANPTDFDDVNGDGSGAKYAGVIQPDMQIMGVPMLGDAAPSSFVQFAMPAAASKAVVSFGSLGLGGADAFSKKALIGTVLTTTLNIGLPLFALTFGLAVDLKKGFGAAMKAAMEDEVVLATILGLLGRQLNTLRGGVQTSVGSMSAKPFLLSIAPTLLQMLLKSSPRIAALIAAEITKEAAKKAIPIIGEALWVLSTVIDLAIIAETLIECVAAAAITRTEVTLAMDTTVRVSRDPDDYQFPATARKLRVAAYYDGGATPRVYEGAITTGQADPVDVVLSGVPSGGSVEVRVFLYSDTDCLVGYGTSGKLSNLPATASLVPVQIKELLVPLNDTTSYLHQSKLGYQGGAHVWDASAPAPSATYANLCKGGDDAICALHGITVHTPSGMAGYAYNVSGASLGVCGGGSASAVSRLQNVFLGDHPDTGLKRSTCGTVQPLGIVYEPRGDIVGGRNYFLRDGGDGFFHLCRLDLVAGDFDFANAPLVGRFHQALESLCVTEDGVVAGVNRNTNTMEVLKVQLGGTDEASNFAARVAQAGSIDGRLGQPVAVAAHEAVLLVLEQGNRRVQAFDVDGSTLKLFKDAAGNPLASSSFPVDTDPAVVYLDIAVEGKGYVYLLSYRAGDASAGSYRLDLYAPDGSFVSRTTGVAAGALAVDLFRNVYTLNYEPVAGAPQVEPSISKWLPHSTVGCPEGGPAAARGRVAEATCAAPKAA